MIKNVKIKNKKIGIGNPCYIIAEIGSNFDGNLKKAKKLIKLAKESGADAAKRMVNMVNGLEKRI